MRTTDSRRTLAALGLVPVAAGVFAGSVVWATDHSPTGTSDAPPTEPVAVPAAALTDPQDEAIAEHLATLGARLAAVQAELDARAAQAAVAADRPVPAPAPAPRPRPAPRAAPPVDTTTKASG